jgi:hypothetical protein
MRLVAVEQLHKIENDALEVSIVFVSIISVPTVIFSPSSNSSCIQSSQASRDPR